MEIVIKAIESPNANNPEDMVKWFCEVFGLASQNEENSIEEQLLKRFIVAAHENQGISSSEIKLEQPLARSTTIYHLNRLIDAGLIVKKGRKYYLRATDLSKVIEEIEYDMEREMRKMMDLAKLFDQMMQNAMEDGNRR